jgi:hypothetical protein
MIMMWSRSVPLSFLVLAACQPDGEPPESLDSAESSSLTIHVDDDAAPGGDGSADAPFDNLPAAVAHAREQAGPDRPVAIRLAPGVYPQSETLSIDFPVALRGSNQMSVDQDGWPTGELAPGSDTVILGTAELGADTMVKIGAEAGPVLRRGVTVRDLTFDLGPGTGHELHVVKTQGFHVAGNIFRGDTANIGFLPVASSGLFAGNYMSGVGAGTAIDAGPPGSPTNIVVVGNRAVDNRFGGVLLNGSGHDVPETNADRLHAAIVSNDISDNNVTPRFSFGIRVFAIRRDVGTVGDQQATGGVTALIRDNRIVGNELGMSIDAGFPFRQYRPCEGCELACDDRVYRARFDLTLVDNDMRDSLLLPAIISFTRNTAAFEPETLPSWQYLHASRFRIRDPDGSLTGFVYDHPEVDLLADGTCAADQTSEVLDNELVYNGATIPHGDTVP